MDRCYWAFGLLSLLLFIIAFIVYRAFRPWAFIVIFFPISDFQTYVVFIFLTYVVIGICGLDLMVLYLTRYYNLEFIIISVFIIMLFSHLYYFEKTRCYIFGIRAGFRPGSDPG